MERSLDQDFLERLLKMEEENGRDIHGIAKLGKIRQRDSVRRDDRNVGLGIVELKGKE